MPSPIGEQVFMPQSSPTETATKWLAWNAGCYVLAAARFPYLRFTYESFVEDPLAVLGKLSAFTDEALVPSESHLRGKEVQLGEHHIFSGNPMRATTGWIPVRIDNEWQRQLPASDFAKVTALTWPLLRLNRYPTVPAARRSRGDVAGDHTSQ